MRKVYFLAFVLLSLMACNKNDSSNEVKQYTPVNFKALNIGALHNNSIISVFKNRNVTRTSGTMAFTQQDMLNNYKAYFSGIDFSPVGSSSGEMYWKAIKLVNELAEADYDFRNMQNTGASENVTLYMKKLLDGIEAGTDLTSINQYIDALSAEANANLTGFDLDVITGTCIIAKSSAKLWAPVSEGGLGYGSQVSLQTGRSWWGKMIVGDVSGSAGYFLGMGIGGAVGWFVPGANVAILGMWALTAGIASASALGGFFNVPLPPQPEPLTFNPNNVSLIYNEDTTP